MSEVGFDLSNDGGFGFRKAPCGVSLFRLQRYEAGRF
jgi:hypothetical protein